VIIIFGGGIVIAFFVFLLENLSRMRKQKSTTLETDVPAELHDCPPEIVPQVSEILTKAHPSVATHKAVLRIKISG
jgi:hypothetical protein